jgi:uncharacterized protein (DUF2252 family)
MDTLRVEGEDMSQAKAKKQFRPPSDRINLRAPLPTVQELHDEGKARRERVPRELHGQWKPAPNREDVLKLIEQSNVGRQQHLVPLRMERMAASPFAFLRGAAGIMGYDLFKTPDIGCHVVLAGDAHLSNFGIYGSAQRELLFDINDFDETVVGPWEWDLKRLTASVNVAGRENGLNVRERATAVAQTVMGYQDNMQRLESMGTMDIWYLHAAPGRSNVLRKVPAKAQAVIDKVCVKAMQSDNLSLLAKIAEKDLDGHWKFREDPPILTFVTPALKTKLITALEQYAFSLRRERRHMLSKYRVMDVAHRVVGVGSVGTRAYLILLMGKTDNDPLFLQVKEAITPALAPYLPKRRAEYTHDGQRVVVGQHALQASSDVMLGWTEIEGRTYYVRQMKNLKASIPVEWLVGESFNFYGYACGAVLARAHARISEPAIIAGYCGRSNVLRTSLAAWAEAYGNQTEMDHAKLVAAIKQGQFGGVLPGKTN